MINIQFPPRPMRQVTMVCGAAAAILLSASALMGFAPGSAGIQTPAKEQPVSIDTDYELPPSSLDTAWVKVPIIVLARVQSSAVRERLGPRNVRIPFTEHQVTVLEVFKGAELLDQAKTLLVSQTTVEKGATASGVIHEGGGRLFRASEEYVLFLERVYGTFGVAWGAGGAYKVSSTTVDVPAASQRMWGFRQQLTRNELLTTLRAKRDKSHGNK